MRLAYLKYKFKKISISIYYFTLFIPNRMLKLTSKLYLPKIAMLMPSRLRVFTIYIIYTNSCVMLLFSAPNLVTN
jgi:hypothetical protein